MLKTRIIPTLLWKGPVLVKDIAFKSERVVGTIIPSVKVYNTRQVDEMIVVDITASNSNREPDYLTVEDFSGECFMPLTVGGGIKNSRHVHNLLKSGADKVAINSALFDNPKIISDIANIFGSQVLVASIDVKKHGDEYICYSNSGTKCTEKKVDEWAKEVERLGAGEILITSIEKDGTMSGYDLELIQKISKLVSIPVIASGGCGNYEDMYQALQSGANAVCAASIFHFTEQTPLEAKKYLKNKGIPTRN